VIPVSVRWSSIFSRISSQLSNMGTLLSSSPSRSMEKRSSEFAELSVGLEEDLEDFARFLAGALNALDASFSSLESRLRF
jgi:hypothetical protein